MLLGQPFPLVPLQATCERGFAAMEETHQKKIEDLQRQHQRELEKLREEKDRLLAEETAATISGTRESPVMGQLCADGDKGGGGCIKEQSRMRDGWAAQGDGNRLVGKVF